MKIIKRIFHLIITLLLIYGIYFIWSNQDKIINKVTKMLRSERIVIIPESNEYKRYYNFKNYTTDEDYEPHNKKDLYNIIFNYLNSGFEELTFYCPDEYESCIEDLKIISNDSESLSAVNNYVNPLNSFNNLYTKIQSDGAITLSSKKTYDAAMVDYVDKEIDRLIEALYINIYDNDKDKIKKFHDYIIKRFEYDKNEKNKENGSTNAYGALKNNIALCGGYADTMAIFLDKINIPNLKVSSENHVWNLIYLDNKWYHLDVTWDDPINALTDSYKYVYFLVSSSKLKELDEKEHNYNEDYYLETKEA